VSDRHAEEMLTVEETDSWFEYLESCRLARGKIEYTQRYEQIEPWAWARLQQRLRAVRTRRARLKKPAA